MNLLMHVLYFRQEWSGFMSHSQLYRGQWGIRRAIGDLNRLTFLHRFSVKLNAFKYFANNVCDIIRIVQLIRAYFHLYIDCSLQTLTCCLGQMERKCVQPVWKTTKKAWVLKFEHEHTHFSHYFSHSLALSSFIQCGKS